MLAEILLHIAAVDFNWLISLVTGNLFWLFAILASQYFLSNGKNLLVNFCLTVALVTGTLDFITISGLAVYTAMGLFFLYLSRVAVLLFLEETKGGAKLIPIAWVASFYIVVFLHNTHII